MARNLPPQDDPFKDMGEDQPKRRWFQFRRKKEVDPNAPLSATTGEMLKQAMEVQKDTMHTVERTERLVQESEEMGLQAMGTLQQGRERINQIDANVAAMQPMTQRAKQEASTIARNLVKDKCFMLLLILVIGMIVAIVITSQTSSGPTFPEVDLSSGQSGITQAPPVPLSTPIPGAPVPGVIGPTVAPTTAPTAVPTPANSTSNVTTQAPANGTNVTILTPSPSNTTNTTTNTTNTTAP